MPDSNTQINLPLICGSVVTSESLGEFYILKDSLELFYRVTWYLAVDSFVFNKLSPLSNINAYFVINHDIGSHGVNDSHKNDLHMALMIKKFYPCLRALLEHDYILLLDSDILFVSQFSDKVYKHIVHSDVDAILSPHYSEDFKLESQVGRFNGGMICVKSLLFLNRWMQLSLNYKVNNWYYEQQPIEFAAREFLTSEFPINCNIGWWRMNNQNTHSRFKSLILDGNYIRFMGMFAVCFHVHTIKSLEYTNYGAFLICHIVSMLKASSNPNHDILLNSIASNMLQSWILE